MSKQQSSKGEEDLGQTRLMNGECPYCGESLSVGASFNMYCTNENCDSDFALKATTLSELTKSSNT